MLLIERTSKKNKTGGKTNERNYCKRLIKDQDNIGKFTETKHDNKNKTGGKTNERNYCE